MEDLAALVVAVVLANQFMAAPAAGGTPGNARQAAFRSTLGAASVLTLAVPPAWLLARWLRESFGLAELALPGLVLVVAVLAGLGAAVLRFASPVRVILDATLLAAALFATCQPADAAGAAAWGAGTGAAFVLFAALFAELRERLDASDAPAALHGAALALVSAGVFTLGISGLAGVLRG